jgi:tripartite-type tricarboxylate transporter receptor subunit TctC
MLDRRTLLAAALSATALPALAQSPWPSQSIKVIVPFGPGGLADVTIRIVGEKMSQQLGQQVIVVNQPGAGGSAAAKTALGAVDNHTLALLTNGTAVSAAYLKNMGFDPLGDFRPISSLGYFDFVIATSAEQPYKTLTELVAAAKAAPGKLNAGTITRGSTQNLSAVLLKSLAKTEFAIVPFANTPDVITAVMRKDVDFVIDGYSALGALIKDGKLRALATSGPARSALTGDVATAIEQGVAGYDVTSWNALFAPKGTPDAVIDRLNAAVRSALADAEVKAKLAALGIEAKGSTPAEIADKLKSDITRWNKVIDDAGVQRQ